ncbi:hypothetical protein EDB85DRAFT_1893224 [Lactarius pseudohatsudake]|nr:hypothetical protein EDB85DRAFT_1893224 [Lactarius pseudohatsudake]
MPSVTTDLLTSHAMALEAGKQFETKLSGDERLTTLELTRSHLPTAEFAFLSTYDAAEVTGGSIMDEGLHLAAAVQYAGFQSVVGTMWAIVDEDGRDMAERFPKALFSNSRREQGGSAKALRSRFSPVLLTPFLL